MTGGETGEPGGSTGPAAGTGERCCPECGGALATDHGRGETVCSDCGLVVGTDRVDRGPEWRAYSAEERDERSRVGPPTTRMRHDRGLSTTIGWRDRDARGNALDPGQRRKMRRLRTWDARFRTRDHRERNVQQALRELDRMGSALGLPDDVRETAGVVYRRASEAGLLPGRSLEAVAGACLYAAARQAGLPRSLDEVASVSRVERRPIGRAYRQVVRELGLAIEPAAPESYVGRFASALDLDRGVENDACNLLETAAEEGLDVGRSPDGLAAAAVYAAALLAGADVDQEAVRTVSGVGRSTIRERYRELLSASDRSPL